MHALKMPGSLQVSKRGLVWERIAYHDGNTGPCMRHRDLMFAAGAMEKLVQVVFNESTANSLEKKVSSRVMDKKNVT